MTQCCPNTLEFCQTSVWQNFTFCQTGQNFVGPNFFIKPIVKLELWVIFNHLKEKSTPSKVLSDTSACVSLLFIHQMDIFIFSVGHLVRHSSIFCWTFIKNVQLSDRSDEVRQHWWLPRKCDYRTDGQTDRHRTKWSLCAAMLRRWHKNKLWIRSPTHQTFTLDPTSDKSQGGGVFQTHYLCFRWKLMLNSIEKKICGVCCKGQSKYC